MGCGGSTSSNYIVQYCSLEKYKKNESIYIINLIASEKIEKKDFMNLFKQLNTSNEPKISTFISREKFSTNTIFYYFLKDDLLIKNHSQSSNLIPFSLPLLSKVILLSTDNVSGIPNQIIENKTKHLTQDNFIDHIIDLNNADKLISQSNNPDLTEEKISLDDEFEEESEKEKDEQIVITEEIDINTFKNFIKRLNNENNSINKNKNPNNMNMNEVNIKTTEGNSEDDIHINEYLKDDKEITDIKICGSKIDDIEIFDNLINALKGKNIKKFSFFDNNTSTGFEGWDVIFEMISQNYSLRYLNLHASNLYDFHISELMRVIVDKRIRYLNLSENFITLEGVHALSEFLAHNKTLQKLNLSRNAQTQFKPDGVRCIMESLIDNPNIMYIDFSFMTLTGCGESIGYFLEKNNSLESLILRAVQLNIKDFKNIFSAIKSNTSLKEVDISMNDMGGDKSLELIAEAMKENKSLNTMRMDKINLNNDNYSIIFDAIEINKNITNYSVSFNSNLRPKIMLNFFMKQKHVKHLEYEPFDKENIEDKKKELTLEEKKMFIKLKTDRPDMELIYK